MSESVVEYPESVRVHTGPLLEEYDCCLATLGLVIGSVSCDLLAPPTELDGRVGVCRGLLDFKSVAECLIGVKAVTRPTSVWADCDPRTSLADFGLCVGLSAADT